MNSLETSDLALNCLCAIRGDEANHGKSAVLTMRAETARGMPNGFPYARSSFERALRPVFTAAEVPTSVMLEQRSETIEVFSALEVLGWCLTTGSLSANFRRVDRYTLELIWP